MKIKLDKQLILENIVNKVLVPGAGAALGMAAGAALGDEAIEGLSPNDKDIIKPIVMGAGALTAGALTHKAMRIK